MFRRFGEPHCLHLQGDIYASTSIHTTCHVEDEGSIFLLTPKPSKGITDRKKTHTKPQPSDQDCYILSTSVFSPTRKTREALGYLCFRQRVNFLRPDRTANITDTLRQLCAAELGSSISDSAWYNWIRIDSLSATRSHDPSTVQLRCR